MDEAMFLPDDFDRINKKYFYKLRDTNEVYSDPSFWYANYSKAALDFGYSEIAKYRSDFHTGLKEEKPTLVNLLSRWDLTNYTFEDITICSSATAASLIVLSYLKYEKGVNRVYFETPCYFGSYNQSAYLQIESNLVPTFFENDFEMNLETDFGNQPKVFWITQPRFGMGKNYNTDTITSLVKKLKKNDFLVVDEATEQLFPSHLKEYNFQNDPRIIKIRSPFKGMGINGPRLSCIIHGQEARKPIQNILENIQGSIDTFSLQFAHELFSDQEKYVSMLNTANQQVIQLFNKLKVWTAASFIAPLHLDNGYIGAIGLTYQDLSHGYRKRREELLKYCALNRMPVILGSNLKFAKDEKREFIRINYFNTAKDLKNSIDVLLRFGS